MDTLAFILSTLGTVCICIPPLLKGKNMKLILLLVFSANVLVATSYMFTHNYNGAASCFVGGAQAIINYFFDRKNKPLPIWLVAVYALSFIVVNMLVYKQLIDLIAMVASLTFVMCIGQKNGKTYRIWTFINTALWLSYDLLQPHTAYGPALTHTIQLCIVISGIAIHDVKINKLFKRK